jgi:urease accessory protein
MALNVLTRRPRAVSLDRKIAREAARRKTARLRLGEAGDRSHDPPNRLRSSMLKLLLALTLAVTPSLAFAHLGIGDTDGIAHGFMHPVTGIDHVLAMVAVGLFAAQLGGRALWLVPLTFVAMMACGGAVGMAGLQLPYVEIGIGLSVVVLGGLVATGLNPPLAIAMALVGFFAIFHGHAHGAEMPDTASGFAYAGGFIVATALLHATGIGFGMVIGRTVPIYRRQPRFDRPGKASSSQ